MEDIAYPVSRRLLKRFRSADRQEFLARWTAAEVLAKLHDIPVHLWVMERGLDGPLPSGCRLWTFRIGTKVVSLGYLPANRRQPRRRALRRREAKNTGSIFNRADKETLRVENNRVASSSIISRPNTF